VRLINNCVNFFLSFKIDNLVAKRQMAMCERGTNKTTKMEATAIAISETRDVLCHSSSKL